ncbi:LIM domain protein [Trichinella nativa]|uniref:LIM domain protein n=1 Tax=Trichinella nativa TaxID=6335 RepID=A0A1Y3EY25_9BILA|nr:LIM domain protein [Trichinella nativa]
MTKDEINDDDPSCAKCHHEISSSTAALVLNNVYHSEHVICSKCKKCLDGFSMYVEQKNKPICLLCHKSTSVCKGKRKYPVILRWMTMSYLKWVKSGIEVVSPALHASDRL